MNPKAVKVYLGLLLAYSQALAAPPLDHIIDEMEKAENISHSQATIEQTVTTPGGQKRTFVMRSYSTDYNEKGLSVYEQPARVKGEKILTLNDGDDIWTYSPKTRRVRHMATHMKKAKVMGSDFSYEDMSGNKIREKYKVKYLGESPVMDETCFLLELIPTPKGPSYQKLKMWVSPRSWLPLKTEYYNDNGLLKELLIPEIRKVEGRLTPWRYLMINKQEGGQTEMKTIDITYSQKPASWMFTREGLKKD